MWVIIALLMQISRLFSGL